MDNCFMELRDSGSVASAARAKFGIDRTWIGRFLRLCALALTAYSSLITRAQTNVVTYHYDNMRTGQNTNEVILTPNNVNSSTFGRLFRLSVDGSVWAQPLYVSNVTIRAHGVHNVLYVVTSHDSVYAFDADNGGLLWHVSFLINGATPGHGNGTDINETGITGTPVIDPSSGTMYLSAETIESGRYIHRLHALDITSGAEKFGGPIIVQASVPGTGKGSVNGILPFLTSQNGLDLANQRAGLLLQSGFVYIAYGSFGDQESYYHGWVIAYDATTLVQTGAWAATPNGFRAGIWAAGAGIAADASGHAYVVTANGDFPNLNGLGKGQHAPPPGPSVDFGDSIVRLNLTNGAPTPDDYFVPYDQNYRNRQDQDIGSGGIILLPDQQGPYPHIMVQSGKRGSSQNGIPMYVLNRDQLTADNSYYCNPLDSCTSDPEILQTIYTHHNGVWSMPAYWNGYLYITPVVSPVLGYSVINGQLSASPTFQSLESYNYPGATPAISSNGTNDGIVWVVDTHLYGLNSGHSGPAVLRAYDATNLSRTLYSSTGGRDTLGNAVKFVVPAVANGKVYVGTIKEVDVFGLLGSGVLSVSRQGTGTGTIISGDGNINCPTVCSYNYNQGTQVTLTATAAQDSVFAGWNGCDSVQANTCTLTMNSGRAVTATFTQTALTVSKVGSGTVTSTDGHINCGNTCSFVYHSGTQVTLTATAGQNWTFSSWSGCDSSQGNTCMVAMNNARKVTATFSQATYQLTVSTTGNGTVTSTDGFINCPTSCTHIYNGGTTVTLNAQQAQGWTFTGWGGACSGVGSCMVTMSQAQTVTATFSQIAHPRLALFP